jgi:hypothetical protein
MKLHRVALAALILASLAAFPVARTAAADDSGNFVMQLGQDTTSVEHYTRTATKLEVDQVARAPRVTRRHFVYDLDKGAITKMNLAVTPPGATAPIQTIDCSAGSDSVRVLVKAGPNTQNVSAAAVPHVMMVALSSPWSVYETVTMKLMSGKADTLGTPVYFIGAGNTDWLSVKKLGRDSVALSNTHLDVFHVKVDKAGHVMGVLPIAGTAKFSVSRPEKLDLDAMSAAFAAKEQASGNVGTLSPRDTVKATTAGANLWVDYGRPSKRGRAVFGAALVPYGEVWRTGANAATQFKCDKDLVFGSVTVPAGFYTLWTLPTASGWTLIVNSETGQWGTQHKADKDVYKIPMTTKTLPSVVEKFLISVDSNAQGGAINLDWDTTRASAAFTVKQ